MRVVNTREKKVIKKNPKAAEMRRGLNCKDTSTAAGSESTHWPHRKLALQSSCPPLHYCKYVGFDCVLLQSFEFLSFFLAAGRGMEGGAAMQMFSSATLKMFRNICLPVPEGS